ncbi:MAG: hypothetical protein M3167_04055 [Acidobacteriota bacterium]|nr:hypothetical protein [Acidobacteriota bacterium]
MKNRILLSLAIALVAAAWMSAQQAPQATSPASGNRTDLYHVHFVKAAPGKATEILNSLRTPPANEPMPTHALILRHLEGDDWDFAVIQHLGPKASVELASPAPAAERELRAWHNDTYAAGPSWAEFSKAMGIGQPSAGAAPAGSDVYIVGAYQGAAGHRTQLEDTLKRVMASSPRPGDSVLLQHREGSPWDYLHITRYNGWKDLAAQQEDPDTQARQRKAGLTQDAGLELRTHMASHHDTIANRVAVQAAK